MRLVTVVIIILETSAHLSNAAFRVTPSPMVVGVGQEAQFNCSHSATNLIEWIVNNSSLRGAANSLQGISQASATIDGGIVLHTLTIVAFLEYNKTEVVCEAIIRVDNEISMNKTRPVKLLIQGNLSTISHLRRNSSIITWKPPFSLDLTGVDPDIVYCVEVNNITCGVEDLVVGDCNVTETRYVNSRLQQELIYCITITPRSNRQDAQNGTNSTTEEMFISLTDPKIIVLARGSTMDYVSVQLKHDINDSGIEPDSYSVSLSPIDGVEVPPNGVIPTSLIHSADAAVILNVTEPLPRRRLWNYRVLALGCSEHPVTNLLELSTHDFQNVSIHSSSPGEISVTGNFIDGSAANSILVIVYSDSHSSNVYYMYSPPSSEAEKLMTNVRGLPAGQYNISVFVVEKNGLPFERSVITPRNVSVREGRESDNNFQIEYELNLNSTGVCITCTFLDSSATDCVAVIHQRISQLSSSGLMNIIKSRKFNMSGNNAFGCIPGVDLDRYQVGVVGGRLVETLPNQDSQVEIIVGVTVGILVPAVGLAAVSVIVVVTWKTKKKRSGQDVHGESGDSSSMRPLTKGEAHLQDETEAPAYAVLHRGPSQPAEVEGGLVLVPTSIYSVLDQNPPKDPDPDPPSAASDLAYATVGPSSVSREMVPQDFDHTVVKYSEVQQEAQEEESFTKGVGDAGDRSCDGDDISDQELTMYQSVAVNVFHSIQDPVMASELISLTRKEVNQPSAVIDRKQYQMGYQTPPLKLDSKYMDAQDPLKYS